MSQRWTTRADVVATLAARWRRGVYLRRHVAGESWAPIVLPLRGPKGADILADPAVVARWASSFADPAPFVVESRSVRTKTLGRNEVPARLRLETFDNLVQVLDTRRDVDAIDHVFSLTRQRCPAIEAWVQRAPLQAIEHAEEWDRILDVVEWIVSHGDTRYLRHIDVGGVDTKFVERHQRVLMQVLPLVLPPDRIRASSTGFARRFGFLDKPMFTRLRLLCPLAAFPADVTDLQLRTDELARLELGVSTVFVVENEVTYLAFPEVDDSILIFGGGFAVTVLEQLPWLAHRRLVYWGDIDTHGFAILDRLRERFPDTASLLMDRQTLESHRQHWSIEDQPTSRHLEHLTAEERMLYDDIVEDRFGHAVRLEQERVRFSAVTAAIEGFDAVVS